MKNRKGAYNIKSGIVCVSTLSFFIVYFTVFVSSVLAIDLPADTIVLEAEAGEMDNGIALVDAEGASGEGAIDSPAQAIMTHEIQIPKAGKWYLWVRFWCPDGGADSYWFGMDETTPFPDDGGGQIRIYSAAGDSVNTDAQPFNLWFWDAAMGAADPRSYFDVDDAGTYTFWSKGREPGTLLDQILLTMDDEFNAEEASQGEAIVVLQAVYPRGKLAVTWGEIRNALSGGNHE